MNVVNSAVVCVCTGMCVRLETKHRRPGKVAVLADPQQGPPHLYAGSLDHPFGQAYTPRSQHYDSGAVLEPPHFFAALQDRVAGDHIGASVAQMQKYIEESKADAATRMAATGTSVSTAPEAILQRITARSFLQNSLATRFSAMGLTFQASPEM